MNIEWSDLKNLDESLNKHILIRCSEYDKLEGTESIIYLIRTIPKLLEYKRSNGEYIWESIIVSVRVTHFAINVEAE